MKINNTPHALFCFSMINVVKRKIKISYFAILTILVFCLLLSGCIGTVFIRITGTSTDLTFSIVSGPGSVRTRKQTVVNIMVAKLGEEGPLGSDGQIIWHIKGKIKTDKINYGQLIENMDTLVSARPLEDGEYEIRIDAYTRTMLCYGGSAFTITNGKVSQGFTNEYMKKYYEKQENPKEPTKTNEALNSAKAQ
jgi:hypothetical protein